MKTLALLFLVLISIQPILAFDGDNDAPCDVPDVIFTDTTYLYNTSGDMVYTVYFTVNTIPYWCSYNPATGNTTSNLPWYQYMVGGGGYGNAALVYNLVSQTGCEGVRDSLHFIEPDIVTSDNGHPNGGDDDLGDTGNDDNGNGGNDNGNNGHGNNDDGVDSSNPGNGGGGPNGQNDPSGGYDDEHPNGNGGNGGGNDNGNNGHGNNDDGVDVSNPGNGGGGPNGQNDNSGNIDDEGGKGGHGMINPPVDPFTAKENFNLYPNPAIESIFVNYRLSETDENVQFQLVDQSGSIRVTRAIFMDQQQIQFEGLEEGVYVYYLISAGKIVKSGKLMIK